MRRSEERELFMQLLFQMEMQDDYSSDVRSGYVERYMNGKDSDYFNKLFECITENRQAIDEKLAACSSNWRPARMAKVDLAVLRLSAAEILYFEDVPDGASINEAVVLAKKFGGEDSSKFVNGILGRLAREKNEQQ